MSEPPALALDRLQHWLQGVLINPLGTAETPPHAGLPPHLHEGPVEALIHDSSRLSAREHLAIYQRSYLLRLRECLCGQFPALRHALGEALFQDFADQYVQSRPPASYTLADLGQRFPAFLEETRPDRDAPRREAWPDFLVELARFEVVIGRLFDAHEPPAEPPPDGEPWRLAPVLELFAHTFPVAAYYRAATRGDGPDLPFPERSHAVVVRKDFRLGILDLQPAQYAVLRLLEQGTPLTAARRRLIEERGIDEAEVDGVWAVWTGAWIAAGVLVRSAERP